MRKMGEARFRKFFGGVGWVNYVLRALNQPFTQPAAFADTLIPQTITHNIH